MTRIMILTPTGTLGYGFENAAFERAMAMEPDAIAVDAGSTDPGPHYLGSGETLVSDDQIRRELTVILTAARTTGIPVIVGSAGGSGSRRHLERTAAIVRDIAQAEALSFRLALIPADIDIGRARQAADAGEIVDFEAGFALTSEGLDATDVLVAQMGHEPICAALDAGAEVILAGRACDDSAIAAFAIWKGADPALAIHMGKILECGAFSAEPFAMDVMTGTIFDDHFVLEPGGLNRRASVKSVAAHSLYERENPFRQAGPGHVIDLSACTFEQQGDRQVRVAGARLAETEDYFVKLEGTRRAGFRTISVAGIRCPTTIAALDDILPRAKAEVLHRFPGQTPEISLRVMGRDSVMGALEPTSNVAPKEIGLVIDVVADTQALAHSVCHALSGLLLHYHYDGVINTSGNLAFLYSPSELDAGPVHQFSAYHLMKVASPTELFPVLMETV
ncbi:acyclic terpene utilization AtuA family protein [Nitratireductor aquimarinus]|uniref:acyclic terpene utilization AtuA family protein n=1 Tax=Nitratireductor TaxID=245876 RepID=UPI0019D35BFC|nr:MULTISPECIES: acyclic terpene utilization AtuA family protein [Nitratireductor]MBN7776625.1 acyclic terpene utilization AtuA family protein [Nitratireductor pacificus]MBN7779492.1 acyclic terpene utilization AtuA family protein [Nitratireductor pacificus]MBN7788299.1 acyclic terpene utilization AtuA family protein [Nitratireductor aquimarinus]MBY6098346.1 DUF1446 domain-containing protein [Nitratireductor aquimarinus]MCA1261030.1 DUF1446 domain-containing protein [Nitratireductor aquimarinu